MGIFLVYCFFFFCAAQTRPDWRDLIVFPTPLGLLVSFFPKRRSLSGSLFFRGREGMNENAQATFSAFESHFSTFD